MAKVLTWNFVGASILLSDQSNDSSGWVIGTLILAGAILIFLESVLPGLIAGILGLLCLIAAVIVGYAQLGMRIGNFILLGIGASSVVGALCWAKYFPNTRIAKVFVSQKAIGDLGVEKPELVNQMGVAFTNLRPSGTAVINGQRVDVVTEGGMIQRGQPIRVVAVEGLRVVVRSV